MFATSDDDLTYPTTPMKVQIDTGGHNPVALKTYRIPGAHINWLDEQIDKLLKA